MYSFRNDYSDGGHPGILKILNDTASIQTEGYGEDRFCVEAIELLKEKIGVKDIDIHFIPGGTLTNLLTCCHPFSGRMKRWCRRQAATSLCMKPAR